VQPWTASFNPGTTTLERLLELTREVDFAAFVFAQDDWTTNAPAAEPAPAPGQASPRDNVVFEAGLFGGVLGMRRTFILHARDSKLPTDLLGLTCVRYDGSTASAVMKVVCEKLRKAIENEGRLKRIEGMWWQFSLTQRTEKEPSAISLLKSGIFYYWNGERPLDPDAPQLHGTGEIRLESADRASGYWITRSDKDAQLNARTSGVYLRAEPDDMSILDSRDDQKRAELIAERLRHWKSIKSM
jgi:hypothetical protein